MYGLKNLKYEENCYRKQEKKPWGSMKDRCTLTKDYFNCCCYIAQYDSENKEDYGQRIRASLHLEDSEVDISQGVIHSFEWID
jgi:hypothetical protein